MMLWIAQALNQAAKGVPIPIWLGARVGAAFIGLLLILALLSMRPIQLQPEPAIITAEIDVIVDPNLPEPKRRVDRSEPLPLQKPPTPAPSAPVVTSQAPSPTVAAPKRSVAQTEGLPAPSPVNPSQANRQSSATPPRIATAPSVGGSQPGTSANQSNGQAPALRGSTLAVLRARECARLDQRDRPADCPPNEELMRLLAAERAAKYRPENAEAFSRNELAWRGIPEPCLDAGEESAFKGGKLCIRVGTPPSRVRSPQEICEARGLGGCAPTPDQAAINAAVSQVRAQEAAKAKRP
jgi:hypothetical protein